MAVVHMSACVFVRTSFCSAPDYVQFTSGYTFISFPIQISMMQLVGKNIIDWFVESH